MSLELHFKCPECHFSIKAPKSSAGKKGKCPNCKRIITISSEKSDKERHNSLQKLKTRNKEATTIDFDEMNFAAKVALSKLELKMGKLARASYLYFILIGVINLSLGFVFTVICITSKNWEYILMPVFMLVLGISFITSGMKSYEINKEMEDFSADTTKAEMLELAKREIQAIKDKSADIILFNEGGVGHLWDRRILLRNHYIVIYCLVGNRDNRFRFYPIDKLSIQPRGKPSKNKWMNVLLVLNDKQSKGRMRREDFKRFQEWKYLH